MSKRAEYILPIDYDVTTKIGGEVFTKILKSLGVTEILDLNKAYEIYHRYFFTGSIFQFGMGGSYSFHDKNYGEIAIYNGGVLSIDGLSISIEKLADEYYREKYGKPLLKLRDIKKSTI